MLDSEGILKGSIDYFNYIFKNYIPKNQGKIDLVVIISNYAAYPKEKLDDKIKFSKDYFKKHQIPILFVGQTELYPIDFPTYHYSKIKYNISYHNEESLFENTAKTNLHLMENLGSHYINLMDLNVIQISPKNYPYIYDKKQHTKNGAQQNKNTIKNCSKNQIKNHHST